MNCMSAIAIRVFPVDMIGQVCYRTDIESGVSDFDSGKQSRTPVVWSTGEPVQMNKRGSETKEHVWHQLARRAYQSGRRISRLLAPLDVLDEPCTCLGGTPF